MHFYADKKTRQLGAGILCGCPSSY